MCERAEGDRRCNKSGRKVCLSRREKRNYDFLSFLPVITDADVLSSPSESETFGSSKRESIGERFESLAKTNGANICRWLTANSLLLYSQ